MAYKPYNDKISLSLLLPVIKTAAMLHAIEQEEDLCSIPTATRQPTTCRRIDLFIARRVFALSANLHIRNQEPPT